MKTELHEKDEWSWSVTRDDLGLLWLRVPGIPGYSASVDVALLPSQARRLAVALVDIAELGEELPTPLSVGV